MRPVFATHKYALEPQRVAASAAFPKVPFTEEMREAGYTILCRRWRPSTSTSSRRSSVPGGYNLELLPSTDRGAVEAGLRYVNNDICYPSILVTGQIMEAIESGRYDLSKTAVVITQTGGGCRATNYIALIRKALRDSGHPDIPVISLSAVKLDESNPGFKLTVPLLKSCVYSVLFGDLMMQMLYRTRPYEAEEGAANELFEDFHGARPSPRADVPRAAVSPSSPARPSRRSTRCRSRVRAPSRAWAWSARSW